MLEAIFLFLKFAGLILLAGTIIAIAVLMFTVGTWWWWVVPVYGTIKLFQYDVWWGIVDVAAVPVLGLGSALVDAD